MSLIQEALKRQEEEQKKVRDDRSINEVISDDVKLQLNLKEQTSHPDIIAEATLEDTSNFDYMTDNINGLDDFILPDDFSMDSLNDDSKEIAPLFIKKDIEEAQSLLTKREKDSTPVSESPTLPLVPPGGVGSLKLQSKEVPKKLYEDPADEEATKKSRKKKRVKSKNISDPVGTPIHPALDNRDDREEEDDKKSTFKIILVVVLFLIFIGVGIYYGLTLIGGTIDVSSLTKHIPGIENFNKKSSLNDIKRGNIGVSKVVDEPKSQAGKIIQKANAAAQDLQNAQKQETAVTETQALNKSKKTDIIELPDMPADTSDIVVSKNGVQEKTSDQNLSEKYQESRITERIKAKLEEKRLEEERLRKIEQDSTPVAQNVDWPSLALSGTIGLNKSGAAIFDKNNIVNVGETYRGVKLVNVTKGKQSGVILEYEGQTRFLATGQSL